MSTQLTPIDLTQEEREYVLRIIKEHQSYYWLLAGNSNCSPRNKALKELMDGLCAKLK